MKILNKNKWLMAILLWLPALSALASNNTFDASTWANLLMQNLDTLADIMEPVVVVAGIMVAGAGIYGFHRVAQQRASQMYAGTTTIIMPLAKLICGIALLTSSTWMNVAMFSFFGNASPEANPFANTNDGLAQLYEPALMIARLIGVGVFIKMLFTLLRASHQSPQPGTFGKSMILLLAAILLIHIQTTLELTASFFGVSFPFS